MLPSPLKPSVQSVYDRAVRLLVRREHSRFELTNKLRARGYTAQDVDDALDALAEQGYLSHTRFAEMVTDSRLRQGYGDERIWHELRTHAIAEEIVIDVLAAVDGHRWRQSMTDQLQRKFGDEQPEASVRRHHLRQRGFSDSRIRAHLSP